VASKKDYGDPLVNAVANARAPATRFAVTHKSITIDQSVERVDQEGTPIHFPPLRYRNLGPNRLAVWHHGSNDEPLTILLHWNEQKNLVCFQPQKSNAKVPRELLWMFAFNQQDEAICTTSRFTWEKIKKQ